MKVDALVELDDPPQLHVAQAVAQRVGSGVDGLFGATTPLELDKRWVT